MEAIYDLHNEDIVRKNTILECIEENKEKTTKHWAILLDITERSLYRYLYQEDQPLVQTNPQYGLTKETAAKVISILNK